MKNTIELLKNDILKIKIFRDLKTYQVYRYNETYTELLCLFQNNTPHFTNISIFDDNYFNFLKSIVELPNTKIVNGPTFSHFTVDKFNNLNNKMYSVSDHQCDTIKTIKENGNDLFFIFKISKKTARWYCLEGQFTKLNRKFKIEKLSNLTKNI